MMHVSLTTPGLDAALVVFSLVVRIVSFGILALVLRDLVYACRLDGRVMTRLLWIVAAMIFEVTWSLIPSSIYVLGLNTPIGNFPDVSRYLLDIFHVFNFIPRIALAVALFAFWSLFHSHPQAGTAKHPQRRWTDTHG